jgi:hypothetical protein
MQGQDFTPVVFTNTSSRNGITQNTNNNTTAKKDTLLDTSTEAQAIVHTTRSVSLIVQQARASNKWKREQLVEKCKGRISMKRIVEIETSAGLAITGPEKHILQRVLNVSFK